jgi:hypothetical protein
MRLLQLDKLEEQMAANLDSVSIVLEKKVKQTAQDDGLVLTIELTAHDNGLVQIDGRLLNDRSAGDLAEGLLGANELISIYLREFYHRVHERQVGRASLMSGC